MNPVAFSSVWETFLLRQVLILVTQELKSRRLRPRSMVVLVAVECLCVCVARVSV